MIQDIYKNPIMLTDVYNLSHHFLKENTDYEVSHVYNRAKPMILFGFNERVRQIFDVKIEVDMIMEADELARKMHLDYFPTEMWYKVAEKFKGHLPLRVQALPDGTWCPKLTPFAQIENTEEGFGELVTWFESQLLNISFASGCATHALDLRKYLIENNLPLNRFHSFGMRGHNSTENAYYAGSAWNLFLSGTDDFHTAMHTNPSLIGSIPATAHKTIQQFDDELKGYVHSVTETAKRGLKILSVVIDTYDPNRFITKYALTVARLGKQLGVKIIFRPDSGSVLDQGIKLYHLMKENNLLENTGVIIGEGMTFEKIKKYDQMLKEKNIPLSYFNFGIGAGYFKHIDRDTLGFAMKTCYSNGKPRMKFSADPIKTSIPDVVNIVTNDQGELVVDYTRDGLYKDVYYFDERSSRPKTWVQTWEEIHERAITQKTDQQEIIESQLVKNKKEEFKLEYMVDKK